MNTTTTGVRIKITEGDLTVLEKTFESFPIVIGRSNECHIALPTYSFLSRSHACVYKEDRNFIISDLESKNGVMINGSKILSQKFRDSFQFTIGTLEFTVDQITRIETTSPKTVVRTLSPNEPIEAAAPFIESRQNASIQFGSPPPLPLTQPIELRSKERPKGAIGIEVLRGEAAVRKPSPIIEENPKAFHEIETNFVHKGLRAVIFWQNDVYDMRLFQQGDEIIIGNVQSDALVLPTRKSKLRLGKVNLFDATISIPRGMQWTGETVVKDSISERRTQNGQAVTLKVGGKLNIALEPNLSIELAFAESSRPFYKRTWIENKEEFKSAIRISSVIHLAICLIAMFGAPKQNAPKVENMAPRFAKLLVEPPKQIFAPPPPPPPPPPPVEKPEPELKAEPIAKVHKKMPVAKAPKLPKKTAVATKKPSRPAPTEADQLLSALDAFAAPSKAPVNLKNVKVNAPTEKSFSTNQMMSTLKSKSGKMAANQSVDMNDSLAKSSNTKFKGIAGLAGSRRVQGKVGKVQFGGVQGPQGLTDKEVMAAVNKHVAEIQQCYERSLLDNNSLSGRVEYEWTIAATGSVTDSHVKKNEVSGGDSLNECVQGVIRKINFPNAKNGQQTVVSIGFPFGKN